jgi:hypothetical protein
MVKKTISATVLLTIRSKSVEQQLLMTHEPVLRIWMDFGGSDYRARFLMRWLNEPIKGYLSRNSALLTIRKRV